MQQSFVNGFVHLAIKKQGSCVYILLICVFHLKSSVIVTFVNILNEILNYTQTIDLLNLMLQEPLVSFGEIYILVPNT